MEGKEKERLFWLQRLVYRKARYTMDHFLMQALERGIAVHHAGMSKEYLDLVEGHNTCTGAAQCSAIQHYPCMTHGWRRSQFMVRLLTHRSVFCMCVFRVQS
jgi:hypothetical protein